MNETGQTLTVIGASNAVGGSVAVVAGNVVFTPTANFNGTASFDYTVQDNGTGNPTDVGHVTFTVNAVNDAPVLARTASVAPSPTPKNGAGAQLLSAGTVTDADFRRISPAADSRSRSALATVQAGDEISCCAAAGIHGADKVDVRSISQAGHLIGHARFGTLPSGTTVATDLTASRPRRWCRT